MCDYVYGHNQIISYFVAGLIPHCSRGFGDHISTIGIIDEAGNTIAGLVYHNFDPEAGTIEISGAALPGAHWLTRETLKRMYTYPFHQLGCQMVVNRVPSDDERQLYMLARYGYNFVKVERLMGRNRDCTICTLTKEAWEGNRLNQRLQHHLTPPFIQEAA